MPSMVPMMSLIFLAEASICAIVPTTSPTTVPPRSATSAALPASWLAVRALSALCCTVPVSCASEDAACCRLDAVCSVRWLRSWLPLAISWLAVCMPSALARTSRITLRSELFIAASARCTSPISSWL